VVEGKKVFSITDKGREELNSRLDELDDLEQEISASVRDIAREVKEDVRDTVRSLRDELTRMAKDVRTGTVEDTRRLREKQKEDIRRLKDEQKRQWMEHASQWQGEGERLSREWRRIWSEVWATLGGPEASAPSRADLDAELGGLLADFVERVREQASDARLSPGKLAELRTTLEEASRRIHDILEH
jgi:DNA-binding PadR family transcriptional regulator